MALAIRTGIPVREWLSGDERDLLTAIELLAEEGPPDRDGRGRQMSG